MARETKLTPEVQQRILEAITFGAPRKYAAGYAGVSESNVKNWMARGQADDATEPYASFAVAVIRQENNTVVDAIGALKVAALKDWRAAIEFIKLRAPELFAEKSQSQLKKHVQIVFDVIEDLLGRDSARRVGEEVARRVGVSDRQEAAGQPGAAGSSGTGLH